MLFSVLLAVCCAVCNKACLLAVCCYFAHVVSGGIIVAVVDVLDAVTVAAVLRCMLLMLLTLFFVMLSFAAVCN